jgi:phosphoserine phosphatase
LLGGFFRSRQHPDSLAKAVATMAEERGIDLARSSAYTDSVHDMPLLRAVGFPRVVAPDQQLARVARRDGWPIHLDRNFQGLFGGVKQRKQGY